MRAVHRVAGAALAGLLATAGLLASPFLGAVPPIVPPYVPIDLRWLLLPVVFAALQALAERLAWPAPATSVLGVTLMAAIGANVHASQVLAFLGVPWSQPAAEIDLAAFAASLGAVGIGLAITFDRAHERFREELLDRGLAASALEPVTARAHADARQALAVAGLAVAGLALAIRFAGQFVGGRAVPLPELAAIALVLAAGALLVGLPRLRSA